MRSLEDIAFRQSTIVLLTTVLTQLLSGARAANAISTGSESLSISFIPWHTHISINNLKRNFIQGSIANRRDFVRSTLSICLFGLIVASSPGALKCICSNLYIARQFAVAPVFEDHRSDSLIV
jgi:hypothetical protein